MTPSFSVRTDPHFERLARALRKRHPEFDIRFGRVLTVLKADPHNRTGTHPIKKLQGVDQGDGQYRLRSGRWRFRCDIYEHDVVLTYCGLRREDPTYNSERQQNLKPIADAEIRGMTVNTIDATHNRTVRPS